MATDLSRHILHLTGRGRLADDPADVAAIFEGLAASGSNRMTIYFHGGLTGQAGALALARHFYPEITENFASYPVFVIWETGPLETVQSAMLDITQDSPLFFRVFKKVMKSVARLQGWTGALPAAAAAPTPEFAETDELAAALLAIDTERLTVHDPALLSALDARLPVRPVEPTDADVAALQESLAEDPIADRALGAIIAGTRSAGPVLEFAGAPAPDSATGYLSQDILRELAAEPPADTAAAPVPEGFLGESLTRAADWFFAGDVLRATMARFRSGSEHGFAGTIMEEMYRRMYADKIGRFLWDEMKENAADAYAPYDAATTAADDTPGGRLFVRLLKEHLETRTDQLDLNVIGHSAGTIHIAHFIDCAVEEIGSEFRLDNVIYTAPAINFDLFADKVVPHKDNIDHFRAFTMNDVLERLDPLVKAAPIVYPHSLLYLVSGIFEDAPDGPLVGLQRHLQGDETALGDSVRDFLGGYATSVVYAPTSDDALPGTQARFTSHYGLPGPNYDRAALDSMGVVIRPRSPVGLAELAPPPPDEIAALEPAAAVVLRGAPDEVGPVADDALLALDIGGDIELPGVPAGQLPPVLEQIIGTNDIVDHAVIHALVRAGRAVARIVAFSVDKFYEVEPDERPAAWAEAVANDELIEGYGTGWILGSERRVLVTNNHVLPLPEAARGATIEFGFERSLNRSPRPRFVLRLDPEKLFITDPNMGFGGLDYTVVALSRQAPADLGFLEPVKNRTAKDARSIFIVQHPGGDGKSYVFNHNRLVNLPPRYLTYVSDTLRGSSGSPLFDDSIRLVGIHHLGGYRAKVGEKTEITNLGSRMEVVVDDIAAKLNALTEWDDTRIQHYFGDGLVLDAWRALQE